MYQAKTRGISVSVSPDFLEEESSPKRGLYFWAYTVHIENHGQETIQLRSRHWHIVDSMGRFKEVHGEGVIGEQPVLHPGQSFTYTSGCPLETPHGTMTGTYTIVTQSGESFEAEIPPFPLESPYSEKTVH